MGQQRRKGPKRLRVFGFLTRVLGNPLCGALSNLEAAKRMLRLSFLYLPAMARVGREPERGGETYSLPFAA